MTRPSLIAFVDVLFAILYIFFLMPHQVSVAEAEETVSPGTIAVELQWPPGPGDVDLWVQAPRGTPVGYSNKGGVVFNLLRDDLGYSADPSPYNREYSFSRGAEAGEWAVNVHMYNWHGQTFPILCNVVVTMLRGAELVKIFDGTISLTHVGEEVTVIRFTLDDNGKVIARSNIPIALRSPLAWEPVRRMPAARFPG